MNPYTVLRSFELPHCPEGEHEHFDQNGASLGVRPCEHKAGSFAPGQTVHLSDEQAAEKAACGCIAPAGAEVEVVASVKGSVDRSEA